MNSFSMNYSAKLNNPYQTCKYPFNLSNKNHSNFHFWDSNCVIFTPAWSLLLCGCILRSTQCTCVTAQFYAYKLQHSQTYFSLLSVHPSSIRLPPFLTSVYNLTGHSLSPMIIQQLHHHHYTRHLHVHPSGNGKVQI